MIRIFIGFDHRQPVSYQVLHHSIMRRASVPVSITPLIIRQLPITREGLTPFTYTRYLVPWLCNYEGHAIFMDSDMLCLCDIKELWDHCMVRSYAPVQSSAVTLREFGGDRAFERPSLMFFKNELCAALTPEAVNDSNYHPQSFDWAERTTNFDPQYNRLVGYEDCSDAKILHYTAGVPAYAEVEHLGYAEHWHEEHRLSNMIAPFQTLMGNSVHIQHLGLGNERAIPR